MNSKRLLLLAVLLALLVPGLTLAVAQDALPAKGAAPGLGLTREEAITGGHLEVDTAAFIDEEEPNDTRAQANEVYAGYGEKIEGLIGSVGDVDYFDVGYDLGTGDTFAASIAARRFGSNLDSVLYVYDSAGNLLAANDDYGSLDSYLEFTIPAGGNGIYYLAVRDYMDEHGGADHWYNLYLWQKQPGCEEPNNTRGAAEAIGYANKLECPHIDRDGDVDWYKFDGKKGDVAQITVTTSELFGTVESRVTLYNGSAILDSCGPADWGPGSTNCYLEATLPKTGTFHILVKDEHNKGGPDKRYWLDLWYRDVYEPNESALDAFSIAYGQLVRAHDSPGDRDWYKFYGNGGDFVTFVATPGLTSSDLNLEVYDSDRTTILADNYEFGSWPRLNAMSLRLPHDGWYYISAIDIMGWVDYYPSTLAYELTFGPTMLLGTHLAGKAGQMAYGREDILAHFPDRDSYALYFDGSGDGVKVQLADFETSLSNVNYSERIHDQILLTFIGTANLPGLGTVKAQDIVVLEPYLAGASEYHMFLDGSDLGLTLAGETIDAVAWAVGDDWSDIVFSTTGVATLVSNGGSLTAQDEDLIACDLSSHGWDTAGWCYLFFDGSAAGIPPTADIAAAWIDNAHVLDIYMTFTAATKIAGVTYQPNDIAVCRPQAGFPVTDCTWLPKYWAGNLHGLKGKKIDGLDIPDAYPDAWEILP